MQRARILTTSLYAEVGILKRLDFVTYVPFFIHRNSTLEGTEGTQTETNRRRFSTSGIGDISLGLKYGIIQNKPFVLSVGLQFGIPTGKSIDGTLPTIDKVENLSDAGQLTLQTGDGEFNQSVHLDMGYSFSPFPSYLSSGIFFNNRTKSYSAEAGWYIRGGIGFLKVLNFNAHLSGVHSLNTGENFVDGLGKGNSIGAYSDNTTFVSYGGSLGWTFLPKLGLEVGYDGALYGKNILAGPSYYAAISFSL